MAHEILHPRSVHPAKGYSHVAKVGNTLYIAGQVAQDVEGNLVGKGDMEAQVRQVFSNLKLIMEDAGENLGNIIKLTSFATHFRPVSHSFYSHSLGFASRFPMGCEPWFHVT